MSHILDVRAVAASVKSRGELEAEFSEIPLCMATIKDIPVNARNKNRYGDVLPNPETRVILSQVGDDDSSPYINANFVSGYGGAQRAYIATQGPIASTASDFWRMIWEYKVEAIVMIANVMEGGRQKCFPYWPECTPHGKQFDLLQVVNTKESDFGDFKVSNFVVTHSTEKAAKLNVSHFHFTSWPDHGAPDATDGALRYIHAVRAQTRGSKAPIVVHCSAGIGRSGAFMATMTGIQELQNEWRVVDVLGIVSRMRKERGGAVQTFVQYLFIHQLLADYIKPGHETSMFKGQKPREVVLKREKEDDFLGFTLRGSGPAFVLQVHPKGLAFKVGVLVGDHLLSINGTDCSNISHTEVVGRMRAAGDENVKLVLLSKAAF